MSVERPLLAAAAIAMLAALSACGFHLRGDVQLRAEMQRTYLQGDRLQPELRAELESALAANGAVLVDSREAATGVLRILDSSRGRRVLSITSDARVEEYVLTHRVDFELLDNEGAAILPPRAINVRRDYQFDRNAVLGKSEEEALLRREMEDELVRLLLLSLRAL